MPAHQQNKERKDAEHWEKLTAAIVKSSTALSKIRISNKESSNK